MVDDELRVAVAQARIELREIDARMARLRHDTNFFRSMGFGRDIKDFQQMALTEERAKVEARLTALQSRLKVRRARKQPLTSWLLLPAVLLLLGIDAMTPKRQTPRERYLQGRLRPQTAR